ncbi:hybrid sensor histidine kinase/response regulator [Thiomicrorhabdus xiamenensis]|uniref:Response regulator n=1 Tax=Thiomicrorhabdus xiamenensis TaxID=2739063 RepID=A0A7D4SZP7_9GAMM|nr:response regulator [Thiomicrorhabdus xiamenensis]QKI90144.1 response regulator [Thiomicrorhabdus xiamenensis]
MQEEKTVVAESASYDKAWYAEKFRGIHVLLVEDNKINQDVVKELLEHVNLIVSVADDGREAIDKILETKFDAVLMDVQMPVMDGYEATRLIRSDPRISKMVIIALTASAMNGDNTECLNVGMNDIVSKPIDPKRLYSTLSRWVTSSEKNIPTLCKVAKPLQISQEELIDILQGFDVKGATSRFNNDFLIYIKVLEKFLKLYDRDTVNFLQNMVDSGELESVQKLAATLKRTAKNIGAVEMQTVFEELESAAAGENLPITLSLLQKVTEVFLASRAHIEQAVLLKNREA